MLLLSGDGVDDVALAIGAGVIDVVAPVPAFPIWRRWCHPSRHLLRGFFIRVTFSTFLR